MDLPAAPANPDRTQSQVSAARRKKAAPVPHSASRRRWSAEVNRHSDALDLERAIFKSASPALIARSLKQSAETSTRRKASPFQSAMSMLNFYINRAGGNLPERRKRVLERAKDELRKAFHRGAGAA
jgi:hypothetical protein